jgi:ABC-type dipeptide/oligopeptide/nickel transport system permease component
VTLVAVSAAVFFFTEILPGDIAARVLGRESTAEQRELFRRGCISTAPSGSGTASG